MSCQLYVDYFYHKNKNPPLQQYQKAIHNDWQDKFYTLN